MGIEVGIMPGRKSRKRVVRLIHLRILSVQGGTLIRIFGSIGVVGFDFFVGIAYDFHFIGIVRDVFDYNGFI